MKQRELFCGLLGIWLALSSNLVAQGFVPSEMYRQIQIGQYNAQGLYISSTVDTRHQPQRSIYTQYGNSYASWNGHSNAISSTYTPAAYKRSTLGFGAWKGNLAKVNSNQVAPSNAPQIRRSKGIGGGDSGLPGNPKTTPGNGNGIGGSDSGLPGNPGTFHWTNSGIGGGSSGLPGNPTIEPGMGDGIGGGIGGLPGNPTLEPGSNGEIGGGDDGIPGNPTHAPLGETPTYWMILMMMSYILYRSRGCFKRTSQQCTH